MGGKALCIVCGKQFEPHAPNQKCCSTECIRIHRRELRRIRDDVNRDERNALRRIKRAQEKAAAKAADPSKPKPLTIDFDRYDKYAERQIKDSVDKYARIEIPKGVGNDSGQRREKTV